MIIIETKDFRKELEKLPKKIKKLFQKQKSIFKKNWLDPRLHTKRIKELPGVYSFRITRSYTEYFSILGMMRQYFLLLDIEKIFTKINKFTSFNIKNPKPEFRNND